MSQSKVLISKVSDGVKKVLDFKQNIQANPLLNSKYQIKTPFIRVVSNAKKWLTFEEKKHIEELFLQHEQSIKNRITETLDKDKGEIYINANAMSRVLLSDKTKILLNKERLYSNASPLFFIDNNISGNYTSSESGNGSKITLDPTVSDDINLIKNYCINSDNTTLDTFNYNTIGVTIKSAKFLLNSSQSNSAQPAQSSPTTESPKPDKLTDVDYIKKFQDWMDSKYPNWVNATDADFTNGHPLDRKSGYGNFGGSTKKAWKSSKGVEYWKYISSVEGIQSAKELNLDTIAKAFIESLYDNKTKFTSLDTTLQFSNLKSKQFETYKKDNTLLTKTIGDIKYYVVQLNAIFDETTVPNQSFIVRKGAPPSAQPIENSKMHMPPYGAMTYHTIECKVPRISKIDFGVTFYKEIPITVLVPETLFDNSETISKFKINQDSFKDIKGLQLLYRVLYNNAVITEDDINNLKDLTGWGTISEIINKIDRLKDAKDYVLESIVTPNGEQYGGGINIFEKDGTVVKEINNEYPNVGLGHRPKAGVTGITIDTQGKVGALRKATLNVKAFTLEQLGKIQQLYMRPGMFLFIEWGWSIYPKDLANIFTPNNNRLDFFDSGKNSTKTMKGFYQKIGEYKTDSNYHYDGIFGVVSNFNWSMNDSGEFDIVINIISSTTSYLALQMAQDYRGYMDSTFSVNIFDRFVQLFDVLNKNNDNYKLLSKKIKNSVVFDTKYERPFHNFRNFKKILTKDSSGTSGGENQPTKNRDFSAFRKWIITKAKSGEHYIDLSFTSTELHLNPKVIATNIPSYSSYGASAGGAGVTSTFSDNDEVSTDSVSVIDTNLNINLDKTIKHTIRFPFVTNDLYNAGFTYSHISEFLETQGFSSNGVLSSVLRDISTEVSIKGDIIGFLTNAAVKNRLNFRIDAEEISIPVIKQYHTYLNNKSKNEDDKIENSKGNRLSASNFVFSKFDKIFKSGVMAVYKTELEKINTDIFKGSIMNYSNFVDLKDYHAELTKPYPRRKLVFTDIVDSFINDPSGYSSTKIGGTTNNEKRPGQYIEAVLGYLRLRYTQVWYKTDSNDDSILSTFINKYASLYPRKNINPTVSSSTTTEILSKSSSQSQQTSERTIEDLIKDNGGYNPHYINLKYLLYLINDVLIMKDEAQYINLDEDFINSTDIKIKAWVTDIKNNDETYKGLTQDNIKTEYLRNEIKYKIIEYNNQVKNLQKGIFTGINWTSPIHSRRIKNTSEGIFTSINQEEVIFLTNDIIKNDITNIVKEELKQNKDIKTIEITEATQSTENPLLMDLKNVALDTTVGDAGSDIGGDLLKSVYFSCSFIRKSIKNSPTLDTFFKTICTAVYNASSGFVDLGYSPKYLDEDLDKKSKSDISSEGIVFYDKRSENIKPSDKNDILGIYTFKVLSSKSMVKNLNFAGKLPASFQRVAFVSATSVSSNISGDDIVNKTLNAFSNGYFNNDDKLRYITSVEDVLESPSSVEEETTLQKNKTTLTKLKNNPLTVEKDTTDSSFYSFYSSYLENTYIKTINITDSKDTIVNRTFYANPTNENKKYYIPPIGFELSFSIDGTSGLEWGNLISIDYLPLGLRGAEFQITKITDEIKDDGWSTNISCILRGINAV